MKRMICAALALCALVLSSPAFAQQTTGNITGRITDDQNAAIPGVTVTGKNTETGFVRTGVTDGSHTELVAGELEAGAAIIVGGGPRQQTAQTPESAPGARPRGPRLF